MMTPTPTMVTPTIQQQPYRNRRQPKPNNTTSKPLIIKPPITISAPSTTNSVMADIPKGPSVTVFVGNITERAPDLMIRQILATCGHAASWKRVQGWFCLDYTSPNAANRAKTISFAFRFPQLSVSVNSAILTQP